MKKIYWLLFAVLTIAGLSGCVRDAGFTYIEGKVNIVATTTMIGDLAKEIGQDNVNVTTLMATGVDPHSYVPRPSVTRAVSEADLVLVNGLNLEAKMGKVLQVLDDKLLELGNFISGDDLIFDEHNEIDPHIWFDVVNWIKVSNGLKEKLIELDPDNLESYELNAINYINELESLNTYVINKVSQLELDKRVLITAHDAFSYFGKAYGFTIYSIQGISTKTEASANDIQNLANLIVETNVKAIFLESSIPDNTIRAVIDAARVKGHQVIIGGTLYSDSLGGKTSNADTYLKMIEHNVNIIIEGLK